MLNQVLRKKKLARKAKARKDYERRRNMNNNVPTDKSVEQKEVYAPKRDEYGNHIIKNGRAVIEHVGYKNVVVKRKHYRNHVKGVPHVGLKDEQSRDIGMIAYPKKRKFN